MAEMGIDLCLVSEPEIIIPDSPLWVESEDGRAEILCAWDRLSTCPMMRRGGWFVVVGCGNLTVVA